MLADDNVGGLWLVSVLFVQGRSEAGSSFSLKLRSPLPPPPGPEGCLGMSPRPRVILPFLDDRCLLAACSEYFVVELISF